MSRVLALVLTGALGLCILIPLILRSGKSGFVLVALIATGILWAVALRPHMPAGLKVPLLVDLTLFFKKITGKILFFRFEQLLEH